MNKRGASILSALGLACSVSGLALIVLTAAHKVDARDFAVTLTLSGVVFMLASRSPQSRDR